MGVHSALRIPKLSARSAMARWTGWQRKRGGAARAPHGRATHRRFFQTHMYVCTMSTSGVSRATRASSACARLGRHIARRAAGRLAHAVAVLVLAQAEAAQLQARRPAARAVVHQQDVLRRQVALGHADRAAEVQRDEQLLEQRPAGAQAGCFGIGLGQGQSTTYIPGQQGRPGRRGVGGAAHRAVASGRPPSGPVPRRGAMKSSSVPPGAYSITMPRYSWIKNTCARRPGHLIP